MTNKQAEKPLILITGSSGLLGTALTEAFTKDYRVIGLDIKKPDKPIAGAKWIQCDLTDDESVRDTLKDIREQYGDHIISVIHLAAHYDFSGKPSPLYRDLTVEGTRRLIRGLQDFSVDQFIFSSSLLVMKPADLQADREELSEETPTSAEWDYPLSKLEAEKVLKEEHGVIPVVIMRIAGVYTDECRSLPLSDHIRRIYEKDLESFLFPGEKDHGQPFIHVSDVVECVRKAVEKRIEMEGWELFLVAEPITLSHDELQKLIGEFVHGKEWPTLRVPKTVAKTGAWAKNKLSREERFIKPWMIDLADDHYPAEIERARQRLEWEPTHRLNDSLRKMIDFLKRAPKQFYEANGLPWKTGKAKNLS